MVKVAKRMVVYLALNAKKIGFRTVNPNMNPNTLNTNQGCN